MIEISNTKNSRDEKIKIKNKKKSSSIHSHKAFSTVLENNIVDDFEGTIDGLLNDLKEQERNFLESESYYELNRYKALVKKILKMIIDEGFKTKTLERSAKDKAKGKADYTIIHEIDNKLLEISTAITKSNKAFNLMKTIEEIRGLIFDLLY